MRLRRFLITEPIYHALISILVNAQGVRLPLVEGKNRNSICA